jgi:hypothetical protein
VIWPVAPLRRSSPAPTRGHERASRRPDDGPPESAYGPGMGIVSPGYFGRGRSTPDLPPGQYLSEDFPVLSAGRRPRRGRRLAVHHHHRDRRAPRAGLVRLPCSRDGVTDGRPALCDAAVEAGHVLRGRLAGHAPGRGRDRCRLRVGGLLRPIRNEPALEDLLDGKASVAFRYDARGRLERFASRTGAIGQEHVCEASRAKGGP